MGPLRADFRECDLCPRFIPFKDRRLPAVSRSVSGLERVGSGIRQGGVVNGDLGAETDGFPQCMWNGPGPLLVEPGPRSSLSIGNYRRRVEATGR